MPYSRFLSAAMLLAALTCTGRNGSIAGTTTETNTGTTASVAGRIERSDGTLVCNAIVILHDEQNDSVTALAKAAPRILTETTRSRADGYFRFDSVDTGGYLIEVNDHDTMGVLLPATVLPGDTLVEANGIVARCGSIVGQVDTADFSRPETVSITLPEIGRTAKVGRDGAFSISDLPAWNYLLRGYIDTSMISLTTDTGSVPVKPGNATSVEIRSKNGKPVN